MAANLILSIFFKLSLLQITQKQIRQYKGDQDHSQRVPRNSWQVSSTVHELSPFLKYVS